jgi:hypothetical protein
MSLQLLVVQLSVRHDTMACLLSSLKPAETSLDALGVALDQKMRPGNMWHGMVKR